MKGVLVDWNDRKGFGFIRPESGSADVFIHVKDLPFYQRRPRKGDRLTFGQRVDDQGRRIAKLPRLKGATASAGALLFILFCAVTVGVAVAIYRAWLPVDVTTIALALYALACPVTFAAYLWDKQKAVTEGRRISEKTLHLLELCGGWPAAFAAQRVFRHKVRKIRYQLIYWGIVALHVLFWSRSMWQPLLLGSMQ